MKPSHCPRCKLPFKPGNARGGAQHPRQRTRDHILPAAWGAGAVLYGDVNNIALVCAECNGWRATAFDCWAMLACIDAAARRLEMNRRQVWRMWKLGPALQAHKAAAGRVLRSSNNRGRRTADAVAIGRIVDRLGADAFMWPADTLEAQLHNFEVLVGAGYKPPAKEEQ